MIRPKEMQVASQANTHKTRCESLLKSVLSIQPSWLNYKERPYFLLRITRVLLHQRIQLYIIVGNRKEVIRFRKVLLYGWDAFFF